MGSQDAGNLASAPVGPSRVLRNWLQGPSIAGRLVSCVYRWLNPVLDVRRLAAAPMYVSFLRDWYRYSRLEGAEPIRVLESYPCPIARTSFTGFDPHYLYQAAWAFRRITQSGASWHVDVASQLDFVAMLSAVTRVTFVDIRRAEIDLSALECIRGSLLDLPFESDSVESLSCLHVAEHVGLGRYGDPLDPHGTRKAAGELARVLAPGGNLFFSLPIGRSRLCFNAYRVHGAKEILRYFRGLELVEFSVVADDRAFREHVNLDSCEESNYACGLFWLRKRRS